MKRTLLIISACLLFGWAGLRAVADGKAAKDASKKYVSVYQVPWRCPAALQIGCGSHAKPINAVQIAMITPMTRAHAAPVKSQKPASNTMMPVIRWIQPQAVRSNLKT